MTNAKEALQKAINFCINENGAEHDLRFDVWDWPQGVGLYGMMRAWEKLGDDDILNFVKKYVDFHLEQSVKLRNVNYTVGYNAVLDLYKIFGTEQYRENCEVIAKHIMSRAKRADEGAFEHTVPDLNFPSQIWADTLFMGALFLARWGQLTEDIMYIEEAARQLILHYKYLRCDKTGLLYHGYNCRNRDFMSGALWGRANGWCVVSSVEILDIIPEHMPERGQIIENLNKHIEAIAKYADKESGMWHTVLDHPETYLESTAAACFYYGMKAGGEKGYVKGDYTEIMSRALEAVIKCVADDGGITMASGGTPIKETIADYNTIPYELTYYAQGLGILALLSA